MVEKLLYRLSEFANNFTCCGVLSKPEKRRESQAEEVMLLRPRSASRSSSVDTLNEIDDYPPQTEITLVYNKVGKKQCDGHYSQNLIIRYDGKAFVYKVWNFRLDDCKETRTAVRKLIRLKHDNILKSYRYYRYPGGVLECYFEHTLRDHIKAQQSKKIFLNSQQRYQVLTDILNGLEYLHDHGIVHENLTTKNILITNTGEAKLSDFGYVSLFQTKLALSKKALYHHHKIAYMCQDALNGHVGKKNDIYSFAIVATEVISGKQAYDAFRIPQYLRDWLANEKYWKHLNDKRLGSRHQEKKLFSTSISGKTFRVELLEICNKCCSEHATNRPSLVEVKTGFALLKMKYTKGKQPLVLYEKWEGMRTKLNHVLGRQ
ncbi:LEAF RUST 10 DISEASE-RESISTANCE LOCUS RECEPTOR-LIKE PROTEIN KINASE-like 1.3 [Trichoplax sp. H2]|nr:LEAF RUST 10 DISEASE-RESISTANCE LOCUS RECEPTOR-LIKE PROTEIN KINASE-like 1.3 [Trichoplax sp. H2]|eukprot:RDD39273.1 LEAF RUST 10 DISEASE-RESISTANCE LOCUS RECEPTOR-LIKE PROTEIN KINASE-like 1.3 [Trichoplax sp. H2]